MSAIQRIAMKMPVPVPLSRAVCAGGFIFVSGQLAMDAEGKIVAGDVRVQTRIVLERIAATLADAGAGMGDVVRVTVWLSNVDDFAAFNDEYRKHFGDGFPARSTVQAVLYKGAAVEIEVQALKPVAG
jgi:2-iminobutanoate/2-iminopropanoate deaminase